MLKLRNSLKAYEHFMYRIFMNKYVLHCLDVVNKMRVNCPLWLSGLNLDPGDSDPSNRKIFNLIWTFSTMNYNGKYSVFTGNHQLINSRPTEKRRLHYFQLAELVTLLYLWMVCITDWDKAHHFFQRPTTRKGWLTRLPTSPISERVVLASNLWVTAVENNECQVPGVASF